MTMTKRMKVDGMSCGKCAARVETVLKSIDGVTEAAVDLKSNSARVVLKRPIEDKVFTDVIYDAGYDILGIE